MELFLTSELSHFLCLIKKCWFRRACADTFLFVFAKSIKTITSCPTAIYRHSSNRNSRRTSCDEKASTVWRNVPHDVHVVCFRMLENRGWNKSTKAKYSRADVPFRMASRWQWFSFFSLFLWGFFLCIISRIRERYHGDIIKQPTAIVRL